MERFLNDLLMGKDPSGARPQNPGFMIVGTQNPITMAGRRAPSTALARRLITTELPVYPVEELQAILINKGLSKRQANELIDAYTTNLTYAQQNHLSPIPCCRDVLRLADELIRGALEQVAKPEVKGAKSHRFFSKEQRGLVSDEVLAQDSLLPNKH